MAKRGQNEGSIFQRRDGRWCATVNLGWVNGKRLRKSYYCEIRKEVQEQLTKALSDIQKGLPVIAEKQDVSAYLAWWLENVAKSTVRPSTWISYEELVRLHLRPAFEKVPLSKLTPQHVRSFLTERLTTGLSTRRVQYIHAILRAALNTAVKDQQGVHPRAIQAALGWENLSMLNRYAHFVEEQRQAVASAMDSILTPVAVNVAVNGPEAKLN
jgi:integrase